jgi:hypothetical protein
VAAKNHDAITTSIGATKPSSYTPTRLAENAAAAYLKTVADTNPKYIVLATDGLPNCIPGETDTQMGDEAGAEQSIADALTAGFPTFVVGISTTGTTADDTLNVMAMKGGVPRAGTPSYYSVASTADLQAALKTITGQVVTCNYPLAAAAPTNDPESLTVHIGGMTVAQDPDNGWDYSGPDHTAIKLFGAACDSVTKNPQAKVEVFYGCPGSPPVP